MMPFPYSRSREYTGRTSDPAAHAALVGLSLLKRQDVTDEELWQSFLDAPLPFIHELYQENKIQGSLLAAFTRDLRLLLETRHEVYAKRIFATALELMRGIERRILFSPAEEVDPEVVMDAFKRISEEKSTGTRNKSGRPSTRLSQVRDLFVERERENQPVYLKELAACFKGTTNPHVRASNTISWLNSTFEKLGEKLVIESISITSYRDSITMYRFRRRSPG